jgi:predicted RNA binding protein YcfA (HicA-like mRNA interferase family)
MKAPSRAVKEIDALVRPHGWTWEVSKGGHVKWKGPDGKGLVVTSASGSDHRAVKNALSDFRKQGCPV